MADTNYVIDLILEAKNNATAELNKIGGNIDQLKEKSVKMSESTKTALKAVGAAATAVAGAVVAVGKKAVDSAVQMEPVKNSFERLSDSVGVSADEMLKAMQKASKGTVSNFNLMSAANKAYSLGVVKNTDEMTTLMEIARVKGQAMGRTMEEALEDIVTGLGRGSAMILDNLGIVVKQSEAQEEYAKSIGKTVNQLTEAEKKQALINAVVKQGKEELAEAGDVALTMAERQAQLNTTWENMKVTLGEALVPVLEDLLKFLQPILDKVADFIANNSEQVASFMKWAAGIAAVVAGFSGLALALPAITTAIGILTGPIGLVIGAIVALAAAWKNNRGGIQEKTHEVIEYIKPYIQEFIETIKKFWDEHGTQILTAVFAFWDLIKALIANAVDIIATTIEGLFTALGVIMDIFKGDWESAWNKIKTFGEKVAKTIDTIMTRTFGDMWTNIKNGFMEGYNWIVDKVNALVDKIKKAVQALKDAWNSAKEWLGFGGDKGTRASGGPVYQGQPYLVGENGPEMFVPSQNGSIVKNEDLNSMGGGNPITVNINMGGVAVSNEADEQSLANTIAETITRQLELYKKGIY